MFDPFETKFICSPIIFVCSNDSIRRIEVITISIFQMILIYYNDKWQYCPTTKIDVLNHNDLFPIVRLHNFNFFISVIQCYNKGECNLAYKKVYLVEILDVGFYNIIFGNYILEKSKLNFNNCMDSSNIYGVLIVV